MSKFLKVSVARHSYTDLYVEVPDDFNKDHIYKLDNVCRLGEIAEETTDNYDWNDFDWQNNLEVDSVTEVDEKEAKQFITAKL